MEFLQSLLNGAASVDAVFVLLVAAIAAFTMALVLALWALRRTGVPVYSAAPWTVRTAVGMLALKDGERFCDLGCGLGRVLRSARRAANVRATGFELNPFAIIYLWAVDIFDWKVRVRWRDFRKADLSEFDAVYLYLIPKVLPELAEQLERQLRPGTRVVSVDFELPGWTPVKTQEYGQKIWLYVMGEHRQAKPQENDGAGASEGKTSDSETPSEPASGEAAQPLAEEAHDAASQADEVSA